jgi:hypothetical protein
MDIKTNISFVLTEEQKNFIYDKDICNCRLVACAGSGKTRCIIFRISYLITQKIKDILMLTFSRFTKDDFLNKMKYHNITNINEKNIKTIDSFAKKIIDTNNDIDVSLLSYKLYRYLEDNSPEILKKNKNLVKIKIIFIDEAQDLNETQNKIFLLLHQKLDIKICMIGDPNQTIYQFRGSDYNYMMKFPVDKIFFLTTNFRSQQQIVDFSKYLRPSHDIPIIAFQKYGSCLPLFCFHKNERELEQYIIDIIQNAKKSNMELSDFAILSPTRGYMHGNGHSHGLCLISNILYNNKVEFNQFYEEASDEIENHVNYKPTKGKINLLTYMGSKGLEWKYVILIDADICLINKKQFNLSKHRNDQFLLYVSCSRAIKNSVIFSHYNSKNGRKEYKINPWFSLIPTQYYKVTENFNDFKFPSLKKMEMSGKEKKIIRLIEQLSSSELEKLSDLCKYSFQKKRIFNKDFSQSLVTNIFTSKFIKNLYFCYYTIIYKEHKPTYEIIEKLLKIKKVITDAPYNVVKWFHIHKNYTWNDYDKLVKIDNEVKTYIDTVLTRDNELNTYAISNDNFYNSFVLSQLDKIRDNYNKYLKCNDLYEIRELLFYIIIYVYAIETQHYFHIKDNGEKFKYILSSHKEMYDQLIKIIYKNQFQRHNIDVYRNINKREYMCVIDFLDKNDEIWEIKCINDITLKHVLQLIIYNLLYHNKISPFHFINVLKGEQIDVSIDEKECKIEEIKNIILLS